MALAHLHAQVITRGNGDSAVAKAAYNARAVLNDQRCGQTHDYSRHGSRCLFDGIYAPKNAPEWTHDRAQLWNHVEAFEKHRAAELAREVEISLPHELTLEQNRYLLQDWIKENVTRKGLIADAAIHSPDRRSDSRNIHAHVLIVMRKLDGSEFVAKKDRFDRFSEKQAAKEAELMAMRQSWEKLANRHLERHGHEARIDMGRKLDGEPTKHLGKAACTMEREGRASEIGNHNRAAAAVNMRRPANENDDDRALWVELKRAEAEASTLAELLKQQQERDNRAAHARAELEAEAEPLHREARPVFDNDEFISALDAMRMREARERGDGSDRQARRAMDELARTDPLGTAQHFGHHIGDRLKSPEDMRREAETLKRGGVAAAPDLPADRQQDPGRDPHGNDQVQQQTPEPVRGSRFYARLRSMGITPMVDLQPAQEAPREPPRVSEPVARPKAERPPQAPEIERRGLFGWFRRRKQPEASPDRAADRQHDAGDDRQAEHVNMPAKTPAPEPAQPRPVERLALSVSERMLADARDRLARETPEQRAERERQAEQSRGRGDGGHDRTRHHHSLLWELFHPFHDHRRRNHRPP